MRLLSLFLFVVNYCAAQEDSILTVQYPVKGYVKLDNEKISITGFSYADSSYLILYMPGSNMVNGAYTFKGDARTLQQKRVAIADLQLLKVKRQSFIKGAATGGLIGFGLGYAYGSISYNKNFALTEDENDRRKTNRQLISSLGLGMPAAITGGLMGGIFIKKRYRINGDTARLKKAINKVYR